MEKSSLKTLVAGASAGIINGVFGAGGGMVLVPLLRNGTNLDDTEIFPASISIMLPMCIVTLSIYSSRMHLPWADALPYLIGSALGGIAAGLTSKRIPVIWLHRILGVLIIWGGMRYLWQ